MSSRSLKLGLAAALALACTPALAQPAMRDHRGGPGVRDHRIPVPPPPPGGVAVGPTTAPPPPRDEHPAAARAGFVWLSGRWDWKANKWAWIPGHWERPRAHKKWREGRWEQRGATWAWVDGEWVDENAPEVATAPPPPPPGGPDVGDHHDGDHDHDRDHDEHAEQHHHDWKLDRPFVSSYWPARVKVGTMVSIRGGNFPPQTVVDFHGKVVKAAKIGRDRIEFRVPPDVTSGMLSLRDVGVHGNALPVGQMEVVATGDPMAEQKRLDEERRKAAQQEWAAREKQLAKDQAARQAAWQKQQQEWDQTRDDRREKREAEIRAKWNAAFLSDPETQAELTLHAQRVAELQRAKEIAEVKNNGQLAIRIDVATSKENDRHEQRMETLKAAFGNKGGAQ